VGSAATGEESLVVAATARPDLVLMDINLLGIDGPEATRRLQAFHPRPIVLLISTYGEGDADYLACGAAGYISKVAFGQGRLLEVWSAATGLGLDESTAKP
jgi:DNA-binding NarL/FixJ family response regulator